MTTKLNARIGEVTERIAERSRPSRQAYLARIDAAAANKPARKRLGCANFAHGFAACATGDKEALRDGAGPNLAIVTAYNDMLSAHQPLRPLSRSHQGGGARGGRHGAGRGRRPGDVRRRHAGREGHGAFAVLARCHCAIDRGRPFARHVRRGRLSRRSATRSCPAS